MCLITLENLNFDEALRYIGCKKGMADKRTMDLLAECESLVIESSMPRYRYGVFDIQEARNGIEV